jgi:hypothetical protein
MQPLLCCKHILCVGNATVDWMLTHIPRTLYKEVTELSNHGYDNERNALAVTLNRSRARLQQF